MGTRGLKVVRFRGRYYSYYNHMNRYFDGFGRQAAPTILSDPEKYKGMQSENFDTIVLAFHSMTWADASKVYHHSPRPWKNTSSKFEMTSSQTTPGSINLNLFGLSTGFSRIRDCKIEYEYIINFDQEILKGASAMIPAW